MYLMLTSDRVIFRDKMTRASTSRGAVDRLAELVEQQARQLEWLSFTQ